MKARYINIALLNIMLLTSLFVYVYGNSYNLYYILASRISAETPKVILQQGTAGTSTIYTNNTSAKVAANATAWLSGWSYRKSHLINSAAGAGINYQIKVAVHYGSGTDSGADVYLNSHSRTDFGDVRFTDDDDTTLLDCWMESKVDSDEAVFWVKVADDLSTVNQTIYVYYGKADATTTSNGNNTFIFFDDFSGDLSKWNIHIGTDVAITSGYGNPAPCLEISGGFTSWPYGFTVIGSDATYAEFQDGIIEADVYPATDALPEIIFRGNYSENTGYKGRWDCRSDEESPWFSPPYDGWEAFGDDVARFGIANQWQKVELVINGSTFEIYSNNNLKSIVTDTQYSEPGEIGLANHYGAYARFDNVRVRKYVSPEPRDGAWGSEESGQVFDYVLKVVNQASDDWNIRLAAYDQSNIGRLSNCTIYFDNGGGFSRQIYILNGAYSQQSGNWNDLNGISTVYITMTISATATGTSIVYAYLEIHVPGSSTYNTMVITFEVS
jgi:hypothetical protein